MKEFWDERYSSIEYIYGLNPNKYFKNFIDNNSKGKILLPADGEGRNGVYAAKKGWNVISFDFSKVAVEKALDLAKNNNVKIDAIVSSAKDFNSDPEVFDAIALIFLHMQPEERREIHKKLTEFLKPGGKIFLCAFTKEQYANDSGGPKDIDMLFDPKDILWDFDGLRVDQLEEIEYDMEEGNFHSGKANILCFSATK